MLLLAVLLLVATRCYSLYMLLLAVPAQVQQRLEIAFALSAASPCRGRCYIVTSYSTPIRFAPPPHNRKWTRRDEADFYRAVSTFGIERDPRSGELLWDRFRSVAKLDRKSDESLRSYYIAFRNMCERVCRWKGPAGASDGTGVGRFVVNYGCC